jgi:hypothetical protein
MGAVRSAFNVAVVDSCRTIGRRPSTAAIESAGLEGSEAGAVFGISAPGRVSRPGTISMILSAGKRKRRPRGVRGRRKGISV